MADVADKVDDVVVEKEVVEKSDKKVVEAASDEESNDAAAEPEAKENGDSVKNGAANGEQNGDSAESPVAAKRKSGAKDATDGVVEGTPEKKAKISAEETEESNSTNGSTEVTA